MTILSDLFIGIFTLVLDIITRTVFQVISILLLTIIHTLRLPGLLVAKLLKTALWGVPILAEHLLARLSRLLLSIALGLLNILLALLRNILSSLLFAILDFFQLLFFALHDFTDLITHFVYNVVKLFGLSFFIIWKNFARAVIFFIRNV